MFNPKTLTIVSFLAISLTGCSGEPSSNDIKSAIEKSIEETMQATKDMTGGFGGDDLMAQFDIAVKDVEKLSCNKSSEASGYICDVKVKTSSKFAGEQTEAASFRMVESSDGWIIME